jgi:hypothetical protein
MRSFFLGNGSSGQRYDRGMSLRALCLIGLLGAIPAALAQNKQSVDPPIQATTCQLETHPSAYDHKLVEVRGRVYFGKFDFVIDSPCKPHSQGRVWLDLGGDVQAPGEYWGVASLLPKHKGMDVKVKGYFNSSRARCPSGQICERCWGDAFPKTERGWLRVRMPFLRSHRDLKRKIVLRNQGRVWDGRVLPSACRRKGPPCFIQKDRGTGRRRISVRLRSLATHCG